MNRQSVFSSSNLILRDGLYCNKCTIRSSFFCRSGATGAGSESADRGEGGPASQPGVQGGAGLSASHHLLDQTGQLSVIISHFQT